MSFCIAYKKEASGYRHEAEVGERCTPSPIVTSPNGDQICIGESFAYPAESLFNLDWVDNPDLLNVPDLAIAMVRFDESGCYFATNYSALEPLFFYKSEELFVLSDNFWSIVKKISPSFEDLNSDVIRRKIALCGSMCECETMIKGLEWIPGNRRGHFDAKSGEFEYGAFAHFTHTNRERSLDEVVDEVDERINDYVKALVKAFPDKTFGLGLSGGLDSRAALHYLLANGAKVACFNQCTKRPHKFFTANSLKRAHQIAEASGVTCVDVDWRSDDVAAKKDLQMRLSPLSLTDNAYKYETRDMPDFDVLVTGGAGAALIVGGLPSGASEFTKEDVVDCVMESLTYCISPYSVDKMVINSWLIAHGLKKDANDPYEMVWDKVANRNVYESVRRKVEECVSGLLAEGLSPADALFEFDSVYSVGLTRHGAFETRFGQCRSFCYNRPAVINLTNDIPTRFIEGRLLLRELIKRKMPEFEGIAEENYGSADGKSKGAFASFLDKAEYLLRGSGTLSVEWHAKDASVKRAFFDDMTNRCRWFYELYDLSDDVNAIWKMSPMRKNAIWDMKRFVDCIERKDYLSW